MEYKVYVLICPIENKVRYVGITMSSLKFRLSGHVSSGDGTYIKFRWIRYLTNKGLKPIIKEIESIEVFDKSDYNHAISREKFWINFFKETGAELYNGMHYKENMRKGVSAKEFIKLRDKHQRDVDKIYPYESIKD